MESFTQIQVFIFIFCLSMIADLMLAVSKGQEFHPGSVLRQRLARSIFSGIVAMGLWSLLSEYANPRNQLSVAVAGGTVLIGFETVSTIFKIVLRDKLGIKGVKNDSN